MSSSALPSSACLDLGSFSQVMTTQIAPRDGKLRNMWKKEPTSIVWWTYENANFHEVGKLGLTLLVYPGIYGIDLLMSEGFSLNTWNRRIIDGWISVMPDLCLVSTKSYPSLKFNTFTRALEGVRMYHAGRNGFEPKVLLRAKDFVTSWCWRHASHTTRDHPCNPFKPSKWKNLQFLVEISFYRKVSGGFGLVRTQHTRIMNRLSSRSCLPHPWHYTRREPLSIPLAVQSCHRMPENWNFHSLLPSDCKGRWLLLLGEHAEVLISQSQWHVAKSPRELHPLSLILTYRVFQDRQCQQFFVLVLLMQTSHDSMCFLHRHLDDDVGWIY